MAFFRQFLLVSLACLLLSWRLLSFLLRPGLRGAFGAPPVLGLSWASAVPLLGLSWRSFWASGARVALKGSWGLLPGLDALFGHFVLKVFGTLLGRSGGVFRASWRKMAFQAGEG